MNKKFSTAIFLSAIALFTGCTRNISSNNYAASNVGEAMTTYSGTIASMRKVLVQEGDKLSDNVGGGAVGGLVGGVGGHMIGGGRGNLAATAGGALLGAAAGAFAQRALSEQEAFEYTVKLDTGSMMTIVQGLDSNLVVGQKVYVQVSKNRSRVVAA